MPTIGNIKIVNRPSLPPTFLGEATIIVEIGEIKEITTAMLMNTLPPYEHPLNNPKPVIGSIKIIGWSGDIYKRFLSQNTDIDTYGILTNVGNRIYQDTSNNIINPIVTKPSMDSGGFKVEGIASGLGIIKYEATSYDPLNLTESGFSITQGSIRILVVDPNNLPPTYVEDGDKDCALGFSVTLDEEFFFTDFTDPENDESFQVSIISLPPVGMGNLVYLGSIVTEGELPLNINKVDLSFGVIQYKGVGENLVVGSEIEFNFGVSDVGSGQFYFG